jgi:hypothetical protein
MTNARDLSNRLADLLRREHVAMADFLVALAEFDRGRHWVPLGYTSLFHFLVRELGLSKGAAAYRKTAAELVQRVPEVVEPLRSGRLCITSVVELARVLTPDNVRDVMPRFFGLSKREAMEVAAELQPRDVPPTRTIVTAARSPSRVVPPIADLRLASQPAGARPAEPPIHMPRSGSTERSASDDATPPGGRPADLLDANDRPAPQKSPPEVEPLTATLRRLHLTVSREFLAKVDRARDALSHSNPRAATEEILEAGLDLLLAQHARRKGLVKSPRKEPPPSTTDLIPAHVKREVWTRDGGRCQYRLPNGEVCGSTRRVEFHHRHARGLGGPPTVENVELHCRFHNLIVARSDFGNDVIDRYARDPTKPHFAREPEVTYGAAGHLPRADCSGDPTPRRWRTRDEPRWRAACARRGMRPGDVLGSRSQCRA